MQQSVNHNLNLDKILIDTIINATITVLASMANTTVALKEVQTGQGLCKTGEISAFIGIQSEEGEGNFVISFSKPLAHLIVSRMLGSSPEKITPEESADGVSELLNMISGNTKAALSRQCQTQYQMSIPMVVQGQDVKISTLPQNTPYKILYFETETDSFNIQVSFQSRLGEDPS